MRVRGHALQSVKTPTDHSCARPCEKSLTALTRVSPDFQQSLVLPARAASSDQALRNDAAPALLFVIPRVPQKLGRDSAVGLPGWSSFHTFELPRTSSPQHRSIHDLLPS